MRLTSLVVGRRTLGKYSFSSVLVKIYFCSGSGFSLTMEAIFFVSSGVGAFSSPLAGAFGAGACGVAGAFAGGALAAAFYASCAARLASFSWVACSNVGEWPLSSIKSATLPCSSGFR